MITRLMLLLFTITGYGIPFGFFFLNGLYVPALFLFLFGVTWFVPNLQENGILQGLALGGGVLGNVALIWLGFSDVIILMSTVLMLGTYEFAQFQGFLKRAGQKDDTAIIETRYHLFSIVFFVVTFSLSIITLRIDIETNFLQAIILVIFTFLGLIQLFRWLIDRSQV